MEKIHCVKIWAIHYAVLKYIILEVKCGVNIMKLIKLGVAIGWIKH